MLTISTRPDNESLPLAVVPSIVSQYNATLPVWLRRVALENILAQSLSRLNHHQIVHSIEACLHYTAEASRPECKPLQQPSA